MNFIFVLIVALLIAGPAAADPATLLIAALGGVSAVGVVGAALIRIGVGLAISAIGKAMQAKRNRSASQRSDGGIRTDITTQGGVTPQSFILGRYATAGNITCPFYAHGDAGGVSNVYRTQIIDLSDVPVSGLFEVWIDGRKFNVATDFTGPTHADYGLSLNATLHPKYAGFVWLKFYNGTQTVADPMLVAKYAGHARRPWTSAMIGRGVSYAIMTFKYDTTLFKGEPQCLFVVDGIKLYDWRKDSSVGGSGAHRWANQSTWEWSENPVVMDYNFKRGLPLLDGDTYGMGVSALDLPAAWWTAAANVCDANALGVPRYRAGYEVRMATAEDGGDTPLDISDELMLACSGQLCDFGGTWVLRVGEPALPVASITDEDILRNKPQDLDPFKGMAQTFNAVRASYPDITQQWHPREAPPRYDAAAEAEDGQRLVANLTLPAAPFPNQVQRLQLAWLKDARRMRQHSITLPADYSYLTPLDAIEWASVRNGYTAKLFDISEVAIDPRTLSLTLSAREVDPADYSWTAGDEIAVGSPSPTILEPPVDAVPGFTVSAFTLRDAATVPRRPAILITWTADLPGVQSLRYQVRLLSTGVVVTNGSTATLTDGQEVITQGVLPNQTYQVRAQLQMNRPTAWTSWISVSTGNIGINNSDYVGGIGGFLNGENASWGQVVSTLPTTGNWFGRQVILLSSGKQYIWNGTAWVTGVDAADIIGTLTTANFATTLRPIENVSSLPTSGNYLGRKVFLLSDQKLYTHLGSPAGAAGFDRGYDGADLYANSIIAGKFQAGAVRVDDLAAESFVASKALISDFTNVYLDYDMEDPAYYATTNAAAYSFAEVLFDTVGAKSLIMPPAAALQTVVSKWAVIEPDADYAVSMAAWLAGAGTGQVTGSIQLGSLGAGKVVTATRSIQIVNRTDSGSTARAVVNILTAANERRFRFIFNRMGGGAAASRHGGPRIMRRGNASLLVDGLFEVTGLAAFGGDLQSTDYNPGVSGWRLRNTGAAEFANLVVRSWLTVGTVSDKFIDIFTPGVAPTNAPNAEHIVGDLATGPIPAGFVHMRCATFEARGRVGEIVEMSLYRRETILGVLYPFTEIQHWVIPADGVWRLYNDTANLGAGFDQFQYRLVMAASFTDAAYPVVRKGALVLQRVTP